VPVPAGFDRILDRILTINFEPTREPSPTIPSGRPAPSLAPRAKSACA